MKENKINLNKNGVPIIFGEVLFDIFPDGNQVLGWAPFNAAWYLQGLDSRWSPEIILERAVEFAADIYKIQEATTDNEEIYTNRLEQWESTGD